MSAVEDGRDPSQARPPRMQALARLPIFLALTGKRALIAGDGPPVAWKAELLSAAGADVAVFAERPCEELRAVATQAARTAIVLQQRAWRIEDFTGAARSDARAAGTRPRFRRRIPAGFVGLRLHDDRRQQEDRKAQQQRATGHDSLLKLSLPLTR